MSQINTNSLILGQNLQKLKNTSLNLEVLDDFVTEMYNPILDTLTPGKSNVPLKTILKCLGKGASKIIGGPLGWAFLAYDIASVAYEYFVNDKDLKNALIDGLL